MALEQPDMAPRHERSAARFNGSSFLKFDRTTSRETAFNGREPLVRDYSPHIPRRGAPQAPQGPSSGERARDDVPDTAKIESSFSTRGLSQLWQWTAAAAAELRIFSNFVPQSRH